METSLKSIVVFAVVVVAATALPSAYPIWEVEKVGVKIARLMPDQSAHTIRVRRARGLPPHVSVISNGQLLLKAHSEITRRCTVPLQVGRGLLETANSAEGRGGWGLNGILGLPSSL